MEGAPRTARIAELLTYNSGPDDGTAYIDMGDGEDILYRPVMEGRLPESALYDGSVSLARVMRLNDAIDVERENRHRAAQAAEAKAKAKRPQGQRR